MSAAPQHILELGAEIRREDGLREKLLCAKCRWEGMSRSAVLLEWGDPAMWPSQRLEANKEPHDA